MSLICQSSARSEDPRSYRSTERKKCLSLRYMAAEVWRLSSQYPPPQLSTGLTDAPAVATLHGSAWLSPDIEGVRPQPIKFIRLQTRDYKCWPIFLVGNGMNIHGLRLVEWRPHFPAPSMHWYPRLNERHFQWNGLRLFN